MWKLLRWYRNPRPPAPASDLFTLISVVVCICAWAFASWMATATPRSSRVEGSSSRGWSWIWVRSVDGGRDRAPFEGNLGSESHGGPAHVDPSHDESVLWDCLADTQGIRWRYGCSAVEYERWLYFAANPLRRASQAKPCWWHASVEDIERVRGVTWTWAALAVKLRNEGEAPNLATLAEHAQMSTRGKRIADAFTESCAHHPWSTTTPFP